MQIIDIGIAILQLGENWREVLTERQVNFEEITAEANGLPLPYARRCIMVDGEAYFAAVKHEPVYEAVDISFGEHFEDHHDLLLYAFRLGGARNVVVNSRKGQATVVSCEASDYLKLMKAIQPLTGRFYEEG